MTALKFGDIDELEKTKRERKHNPETAKITVDLKLLVKAGVNKDSALDIMKRIIKAKK